MTTFSRDASTFTLANQLCTLATLSAFKDLIMDELVQRPESEVLDHLEVHIKHAPLGSWHPASHWFAAWPVACLLERIGSPRAVRILLDQYQKGGPLWSYVAEPLQRLRDPQIAPAIREELARYRKRHKVCRIEPAAILGHQLDSRGPSVLMDFLDDRDHARLAVYHLTQLLRQAPACFTATQLKSLASTSAVEMERFINPYRVAKDLDELSSEARSSRYEHVVPKELRDLARTVLVERDPPC